MSWTRRVRRTMGLVAVCMLVALTGMSAQGVVVIGTSSAQLIDLRPVAADSVLFGATDSVSGLLRRTPDGTLTTCFGGDAYCRFYRSQPRINLLAMMHDVDVTAWGLGQGVSVHAQLRIRTAAGDALSLWPQATRAFDAMAAYVEIDRTVGRATLGRQWISSGLGFFNFDGAALEMHPVRGFSATVYGGGTLIQGLGERLSAAALAPVEDMPPPDRSFLIGGFAQYRPRPGASLRVQYQREVRNDVGALYSERIAADGALRMGRATLGGELTRDLATGAFNDLSAHVHWPASRRIDARLELRHSVPYFDLWTIWGAFAPVGYTEGLASGSWTSTDARIVLSLSGGKRKYQDTHAGVQFLPLRTGGWRAGASAAMRPTERWAMDVGYHVDVGFGAASTDGDVAMRWQPSALGSLGVHAVAFQNAYEFTVGEGRVIGAGVEGMRQISPDLRAVADASIYRHTGRDQPQFADWNQRRMSLRLEWRLGGEPGAARVGSTGKGP